MVEFLEASPPGVECFCAELVLVAELSHGESAALLLLQPSPPPKFFAPIACVVVGHENALLSEDISPHLSRKPFAGQTQKILAETTYDDDFCSGYCSGMVRQTVHKPGRVYRKTV